MQKENNFIFILKLYWQHHEEGIISAPNSGESICLIFFWNNPCARNVNSMFCEKEEFIIWIRFETLWNPYGTAASLQWYIVYIYLKYLYEDSAQKSQATFFFLFYYFLTAFLCEGTRSYICISN